MHMTTERTGHTLSATALVHEVYLKLAGPRDKPWEGRRHFYAAAVEAMRQIVLDHARARGCVKRGGGRVRLELDVAASLAADSVADEKEILALNEALSRLKDQDPRMAEVVGLRFFAGLSIQEVAAILGVSERTVKNDWKFAKAWLQRELRQRGAD